MPDRSIRLISAGFLNCQVMSRPRGGMRLGLPGPTSDCSLYQVVHRPRYLVSKPGLYIIAVLALTLAVTLVGGAAPSKRLQAVAIAFPALVGAIAALRQAARLPSLQGSIARPIGDIVGDPKAFLAQLPTLRDRFHRWAGPRGAPLTDETALREWLQTQVEQIHDPQADLLLPTIAAYGELVRGGLRGEWRQSSLLWARELVVVRPGRPWTRRRVLLEVLDALSV